MSKVFEINADKVKVKTATARLEETDFLSQKEIDDGSIEPEGEADQRQFIGLEITAKTQFPMSVKKQLMALQAVSQLKDPNEILAAFGRYAEAMTKIIVKWNITSGGVMLPITPEAMDDLAEPLSMAVFKVLNKALESGGGLEKN